MSRFAVCLSVILQRESGYRQPDGGPWVRTRHGEWYDARRRCLVAPSGATRDIPIKPDSMAYDDDPHDTGGRTCMGVLQRVYDGYRKSKGLDTQDVWRIEDAEIVAIYKRQYWTPLRAGELPPGVDLTVFDMGVNAGIATSARLLQRIVGTTADGHIGSATIGAVTNHDPRELIERFAQSREAYYRQIKSFWRFGDGWLKRNNEVTRLALNMVHDLPPTMTPDTLIADAEPVARTAPAKVTEGLTTENGSGTEAVLGTGGTGTVAVELSNAASKTAAKSDPSVIDFILALMQSPTFWIGAITTATAVYMFLNRRARERLLG